jgi:hypothetical protein
MKKFNYDLLELAKLKKDMQHNTDNVAMISI